MRGGKAAEFGARFPPGNGVSGEGGPRRPGEQRGVEKGRRPQPPQRAQTGAMSSIYENERGRRPQPVRREAAAAGRHQRETHHSRLLGRRLHPAARLRSAKAPGKDGDRAPSRGGPDANLPARRPPLPRLRGARSPNLSGGRLSFRLLCPPSGDRGGAGRREAQGRDRAAELALRAPWWRSSKARGL